MSGREPHRERIASAIGVAIFHALLGYWLLSGLGIDAPGGAGRTLKVFDVPAPPPPPPAEEAETKAPAEAEEGAAAPPDLVSDPAPVVAPEPEIPLPVPPPLVAAPVPGPGADPDAGASDRPGPGTGAGGVGAGAGAGGEGSGRGGGGGVAVRARHLSGNIVDADYPRSASRARAEGSVLVHFTVGTDGRAGGCTVIRSSGHTVLDVTTCRLIEKRFRFDPARDTAGRPMPELRGWKQDWWLEPRG